MANEIEIRVSKVKPGPVFDQVQRDAKAAGKDIEDSLQKGFKGAEQASDRARKGIGDNLDKTAQAAGDAGEKAGSNFSDRLGSQLEGAGKAGAAAAGVAVGTLLLDGITRAMEERKIGGLLAAQTGQTGAAAAQLGDTAGEIFTDNFGESIAEVGEAMKAVFDNKLIDRGAAEADIKAVTEAVMTASQVVGESVNSMARAAQQLVRTGLADSVTEALDMITHASQEGLNASEDLLDTITEYSTKFRDLGLSGEESFGLISQAVKAGARDTDTAADALKEFAIRAIDGSATTTRGFNSVGLSADMMSGAIAKGGNSAREALKLTLDGFERIHDPILRNQIAVDLFGTKAEDLGQALQGMDLDTAAAEFGEFADSTKRAGDEIGKAAPAFETMWKNLQAGVSNTLEWSTQSDAIDELRGKAEEAGQAAKDAQDDHAKAVRDAADAYKNQGGQIEYVVESLDKLIGRHKELAGGVLDLSDAQIGYQAALDDTAEALKTNGATLDLNTEKGRDNQSALNDLATATYDQLEAMEQQGATAEELAGFMGTAREQFIAVATKMYGSRDAAVALADKLRLIPGDYTARVYSDTGQAENAIRTLRGNLINLTNRSYVASVSVTGSGMGGKLFLASGGAVGSGPEGYVSYAAEGGARGRSVVTDELGPEIKQYPDGTTVIPAGLSRSMAADIAGHGGGHVQVALVADPSIDTAFAAMVRTLIGDGKLRLKVVNGEVMAV
jgi:hypothetical protein